MTRSATIRRHPRVLVGFAVGHDRIVAVLPDGEVRQIVRAAPEETVEQLSSIRDGVASGERDRVSAALVLLPPLVDIRRLSLPRLRPGETTALLEHHASRYFPGARDRQVVAWRRLGRRSASPAELLVAAAPADVLSEVYSVFEAARFTPLDPLPAHEAWLAAVPAKVGSVAVVLDQRIEVLRVVNGRLTEAAALRAAGVGRAAAKLTKASEAGSISVVGRGDVASDLFATVEASVADSSTGASPQAENPVYIEDDPAAVAARVLGRSSGRATTLTLVPPDRRAAVARRTRRTAGGLWVAAAVLLLAAGLTELWGVRRELDAVRAERRAIAERVEAVMDRREGLLALQSAIATLDSLEMSNPMWSGVVADLARHLPTDAHLVALRAGRDSIAIEGVAAEAARVFSAVGEVDGLSRVVARAPIRREQEGLRAIERFSLAARVDAEDREGGE